MIGATRVISVLLTGDSAQLRAALVGASRDVEAFGASTSGATQSVAASSKLMQTAVVSAAVAVAAGMAVSVKAAGDFESAMLRIQTHAGASAEEIRRMSKAVLELAPAVGVGPQKLAEGLYFLESTGLRGAKALDVLTLSAQGARVGNSDFLTTVNAMAAVLASGIGGVHSASQAMGLLNAIVGQGKMTMQEFAASLSSGLLSSAKAFGVDLQSVGAAMDVLTNAGEPAEQAATRLRMSLVLLGAPTKQSARLLQDLGLSEDEARVAVNSTTIALQEHGVSFTRLAEDLKKPNGIYVALQDVKTQLEAAGLTATQQAQVIARAFGGGRSGTAILTLYNDLEGLRQKFDNVGAGASEFGHSWELVQRTFNQQVAEMVAGAQALAVQMGNRLLPGVMDVLAALREFASAVGAGITDGIARLSGFFDNLASAGSDIMRTLVEVARGLAPLASAIAGIVGGAAVATLTALSQALATVAGFLAEHPALVEAVAVAYGVRLTAALAESALFTAKWAASFVQLKVAAGGGLGAVVAGAASAAAPVAALAVGFEIANNAIAKADTSAKKMVATLTGGFDTHTLDGINGALDVLQGKLNEATKKDTGKGLFNGLFNIDNLGFLGFNQATVDSSKAVDGLRAAIKDLVEGPQRNFLANQKAISDATGLTSSQVADRAKRVGVDLSNSFDSSGDARRKIIDDFAKTADGAGAVAVAAYKAGKLTKEQLDAIAASAKAMTDEIVAAGKAAEKAFAKQFDLVGGYAKEVVAHQKALDSQATAEENLAKASEQAASRRADAQRRVDDAVTKVADAERKLADASTSAADNVAKAQENVAKAAEDAAQRVVDARRRQEDAAQRVVDAEQKLADASVSASDRVAKAQDAVTKAVEDSAQRVADAHRKAEDAAQRVLDSEQRLADAQTSAADRVASAEQRLSDAHDKERDAQLRLSDARQQAVRDLQDLRDQAEGAGLSEERAQLRLEDARAKKAKVDADSASTARDRKEASLSVREAELSLHEATQRRVDQQAALNKADAEGVEGSKKVLDAQRQLTDAQRQAADAQAALTKAQQDGARQVADAQSQVAKSQRDLADAQTALLKAQEDGAAKVAESQKALAKAQSDGAKEVAAAQRDVAKAQRDAADAAAAVTKAQVDGAKQVADAQSALVKAQVDGARQVADAQDAVARAQQDVARAQEDAAKAGADGAQQVAAAVRDLAMALKEVADTDLASFFARTAADGLKFADDIQAALRRGLSPELVSQLATEGADKAGEFLRRILGDATGAQVAIVNTAYEGLKASGANVKVTAEDVTRAVQGMVTGAATAVAAGLNLTAAQLDASLHASFTKSTDQASGWSHTLLSSFQNVEGGAAAVARTGDETLHQDLGRTFDESGRDAHAWEAETVGSASDVERGVQGGVSDTVGHIAHLSRDGFQASVFYADIWARDLVRYFEGVRDQAARKSFETGQYLIDNIGAGTRWTGADINTWAFYARYNLSSVIQYLRGYAEGGHREAFDNGGFLPTEAVFQPAGTLVQWAEPQTQGEWFFPESKKQKNLPLAQEMLDGWGYEAVPVRSFAGGGMDRGFDGLGYPNPPSYGRPGTWTWPTADESTSYVYGRVRQWDANARKAAGRMAEGGFLAPRSYAVGGHSDARSEVDARRYASSSVASSTVNVHLSIDARGSVDPFATTRMVRNATPEIVRELRRFASVNGLPRPV